MHNLQNEANKLRMTPAERAAMKARIFGAPVGAIQNSPAPVSIAPQPSSYFAYNFLFLHTRVLAGAFAVVLVFGGVGTTAAAQGALPGDFLYPVKVSVNEAVEVAFATTPKARAEVSAKQALRRVEEAEALAARGELDPQVGAELAADFESHADTAQKSAEAVAVEDPAAAESLRTKLSSSLAVHGAILATLTEGGAEENQQGAEVVAARIIARADTGGAGAASLRAAKAPAPEAMTMSLMVATDTATGTGTTTDTGASSTVSLEEDRAESSTLAAPVDAERAERLRARAVEALEATRERFEEHKDEYLETVVTRVSGEFADIEKLLKEELYTEAFERATRLEVLLRVEAKLKRNIITPVLEQHLNANPTNFPLL